MYFITKRRVFSLPFPEIVSNLLSTIKKKYVCCRKNPLNKCLSSYLCCWWDKKIECCNPSRNNDTPRQAFLSVRPWLYPYPHQKKLSFVWYYTASDGEAPVPLWPSVLFSVKFSSMWKKESLKKSLMKLQVLERLVGWLVLWHINFCRSFNAKSILCK